MSTDDSIRILHGDCREMLKSLGDESAQCCVTSPPYWGLRDYGTAKWQGGDDDCDHWAPAAHGYDPHSSSTLGPNRNGCSPENSAHSDATKRQQFKGECGKCGAKRIDAQIGMEATHAEFVANLVAVFREVRRVLRNDGTAWLNLGDSYVANCSNQNPQTKSHNGSGFAGPNRNGLTGLKPKDLVGIPWRVAFALQADGWYLRCDIIWNKPNPMPESVTDRPTKTHEYIFLLSKSDRYFYDHEAIKEPCESGPSDLRKMAEGLPRIGGKHKDLIDPLSKASATTNIGRKRSVGGSRIHGNIPGRDDGGRACNDPDQLFRNKRSVWTVATSPYSGAHFATFPPDLIKPCIMAGSRPGDTILDPFGGSGTTGKVALELGRKAILCELNADYLPLIERRTNVTMGLAL